MNQHNNNWNFPQRQAVAGLLIIIWKAILTIIKIIWPIVIYLVLGKGRNFEWVQVMLIIIPAIIFLRSIIEFFYFRFYILNNEFIIKKGLIQRKTITIPLEKIQAVHIEQTLVHQLAKIAKVSIDTAGSEKMEAVIDAVAMDKAEELKSFLLHEHDAAGTSAPAVDHLPETPLIRLSFTDIVKLGFSANHIQAFFIVLAFVFSVVQNLEEIFGHKVIRIIQDNYAAFTISLISILLAIGLVLFISIVVSFVRSILQYYNFELADTPQGFKLKTGLVNTKQFLVPFSKVQFISWDANWLRRKIRLYTLEFHQVASGLVRDKQKIKIPITQTAFIEKLLHRYHSDIQQSAHSVHIISTAYAWRRTLFVGIIPIVLLLLIVQLIWWKMWLFWLALWIPYVFINALIYQKNFRLYVVPDAFQVKTGIWGRTVKIVKWYKVQKVTMVRSIYQRQHDLASLILYTAGGSVHIPYISLELAQYIRNYALYETERSDRPWL